MTISFLWGVASLIAITMFIRAYLKKEQEEKDEQEKHMEKQNEQIQKMYKDLEKRNKEILEQIKNLKLEGDDSNEKGKKPKK